MIRKWLIIIVLLGFGIAGIIILLNCSRNSGDATKVALIPAAPELASLTDMTLAEMSDTPGIEFIERADITTILKEHQLTAAGLTEKNIADWSKIIHADLFAIITAKKTKNAATSSGLIVYSARSGFRLVNVDLPEQNTTREITAQLKKAIKTHLQPERQIWLSVVAVRDAGIPERFKNKTAYIAAELERRLSAIPNVIVLERDYLDSVNQERELTGQMFKLAPSARLIRLEFSPGSTAEIADLKLRITNAADHELFRWQQPNCLGNEKETMTNVLAAVTGYLKVGLPESVSANQEAERFFAEYQFASRIADYTTARRKLDAAIAMEPKKREYRLAVMKLNKDESTSGNSVKNVIVSITKNLNLAREIQRDYPSAAPLYSPDYFNWSLINKRHAITRQEQKELARLANDFRPLFQKEIRKQFYKYDLSNGINSFMEWKMFNRCELDMNRFVLYWDENRWCEENYKTAVKNLEYSRDFFKANPDPAERDAAADWFSNMMMEYGNFQSGWSQGQPLRNPEMQKAMEKMFRQSEDYIAKAANHPLYSVRFCAITLELLRKTVISKYNENEFRKNMQEYCRQDLILVGGSFKGTPDDYALRSFFLFGHARLAGIMAEVRGQTSSVNTAKTTSAPLPEKPDTTTESSQINVESKRIAFLEDLAIRLSVSEKITVKNAFYDNDGIYLLLYRTTGMIKSGKPARYVDNSCWAIGKFKFATGKTTLLSNWTPWRETLRKATSITPQAFAVGDRMAATEEGSAIILLPLDGGGCRQITDLPGKKVMATAILKGRIYAFIGQNNGRIADETVLFSCNFDGSDRKIHMSTSRDDKQNPMDKERPFVVHSMFADPQNNRLVFNCNTSPDNNLIKGLWAFYPETQQIKCLFDKKYRPIDENMMIINHKVFFSIFHDDYCVYDLTTDRCEIFFSLTNPQARHYVKEKSLPNQEPYYYGPFFARESQIWFGGNGRLNLLTLMELKRSPGNIMSGNCSLLYPHPDGRSAIVIDEKNIYKVTPKECAK